MGESDCGSPLLVVPLADFIQALEIEDPESAIVFCNTREQTKRIAHALKRQGYAADWLNADLSQNEREQVMAATRQSSLRARLMSSGAGCRAVNSSARLATTSVSARVFSSCCEGSCFSIGRIL